MTPLSFAKMLFRRSGSLDDPPESSTWDYIVVSSTGQFSGANDEPYTDAAAHAQHSLADMLGFVMPPQEVTVWTVHTVVASSLWHGLTASDASVLFKGLEISESKHIVKETVTTVPHPEAAAMLRAAMRHADPARSAHDDLD